MSRRFYRFAWQTRALQSLYDGFCRVAPLLRPVIGPLGVHRSERLLARLERRIKGTLFHCQMCGQCDLSSTGMVCPMNCGKKLRNGPCGGVTDDGNCEVSPEMSCVWLDIAAGAGQMTDPSAVKAIRPPLDHSRQGSATWLQIIQKEGDRAPATGGDQAAPARREPGDFERACLSGRFLVTAEISPPDSVDPRDLLQRAAVLRGLVDALNVTDNAGANCHLSSAAASALLAADGHTPVLQATCRDRNRIALQADLMGAAALGVRNVLCLTGDGVGAGDHPQAKPVFDLDSVSLLVIVKGMRDQGRYASGRKLISQPDLFLGATTNPFVPSFEQRVLNLEQKVAAGAQFVQTQFCFDLALMEKFMHEVRAQGLEKRCHILVGVGPLPSARTAKWLNGSVPGVHIPPTLIRRLELAEDHKREGVRICIETIKALKQMSGVKGVHLMGHKNETVLAEIIEETGLARRPATGARSALAVGH